MILNKFDFKMAEEGGLLGSGVPAETTSAPAPGSPSSVQITDAPKSVPVFPSNDWRSTLPQEIQESGWIKSTDTPEALAKAYAGSLKAVGADKIIVPNKYATEQDWKNVYTKLGLPESVDKYEIKLKEGTDFDSEILKGFKTSAHTAGILPQQAQKIMDWFDTASMAASEKMAAEKEAGIKKGFEGLRSEFGQAYDMKLKSAQAVVSKFADDDFKKHLEASGLDKDPNVIKFFAKIGESFSEDSFKGTAEPGKQFHTPERALKEANAIMGDMNSPYNDKKHPGHDEAVREVRELFKQAYAT